jgi:hypothetical protein
MRKVHPGWAAPEHGRQAQVVQLQAELKLDASAQALVQALKELLAA